MELHVKQLLNTNMGFQTKGLNVPIDVDQQVLDAITRDPTSSVHTSN